MTIEISATHPQPTHPGLIRVVKCPGEYMSYAVADRDIEKNQVLSYLDKATLAKNAYTSVQVSPSEHIELNSDLVYINHSCEPNVAFVVGIGGGVHDYYLKSLKNISKGEALEFFYPSTEYSMSQPFKCLCNTKSCLGEIKGAESIDKDTLNQFPLNDHIKLLKSL
ncbi:hypothetical protein E3P98_02014 [Wallemia ichthyophaga]|nr:hypothetical protein E3P98_02014 [Wallemia ichthyophaga]